MNPDQHRPLPVVVRARASTRSRAGSPHPAARRPTRRRTPPRRASSRRVALAGRWDRSTSRCGHRPTAPAWTVARSGAAPSVVRSVRDALERVDAAADEPADLARRWSRRPPFASEATISGAWRRRGRDAAGAAATGARSLARSGQNLASRHAAPGRCRRRLPATRRARPSRTTGRVTSTGSQRRQHVVLLQQAVKRSAQPRPVAANLHVTVRTRVHSFVGVRDGFVTSRTQVSRAGYPVRRAPAVLLRSAERDAVPDR